MRTMQNTSTPERTRFHDHIFSFEDGVKGGHLDGEESTDVKTFQALAHLWRQIELIERRQLRVHRCGLLRGWRGWTSSGTTGYNCDDWILLDIIEWGSSSSGSSSGTSLRSDRQGPAPGSLQRGGCGGERGVNPSPWSMRDQR